ncbi:hypothetical protein [Stappia sp. WLB 29]|uniref:hypothetical protein n=1 Tax=Stappia sp. WLB 29 TaxID=2925220 RepID=UPI0020BE0A0B|nr:hypothetical protein [Stappia sp. WLB 29]
MTPIKPRRSGGVHDAVARAFEEIEARTGEQGIAAAADTLGVSKWTLYAAADPDRDGELSLLRAGLLTQVYGIRSLAEWLADKAGCDLAEREAAPAPLISDAMAALGQCVQDLADGEVSEQDMGDIRRTIALLQGLLEARARRGAQVMPMAREGRS